MKLSVAIITHNEAANIGQVLASVSFADEVVLVDAYSTDETIEIAKGLGARAFLEEWKGFAAQKNSAIAKCTGDWVLSLDADEAVSPELQQQIVTLLAGNPQHDGYYLPRRNYFLGRWIKHGGFYPDAKLRLFKRGSAHFAERAVHETMQCTGTTGTLSGDLIHHSYPTLENYLGHMNRYSSLGAEVLIAKNKTSRGPLAFYWNVYLVPQFTFTYNYFFRFGFLDGREGLLLHLYHAVYVSWKYAKAWQRARSL